MKASLNIGKYENIELMSEISFYDVMDGTPDTMIVSFIFPTDLTKELQLKTAAIVTIEDDIHKLIEVGSIDLTNNLLTILGVQYTIDGEFILSNNIQIGVIDKEKNTMSIDNITYIYINNIVYRDNRKYYYMCLSQISSSLNSTNVETNGYTINMQLKEQTVWLKDCIRTDLAITPSEYPLIPDIDGSGIEKTKLLYPTLLEATYKVCDKHNMNLLNVRIETIDKDLMDALSKVSCPNLTYKDLSTYDQLYDIFMRVGRIPYFENGTLYGLVLTGNKDIETALPVKLFPTKSEETFGVTITTTDTSVTLNGTLTGTPSFSMNYQIDRLEAGVYFYECNKNYANVSFYDDTTKYSKTVPVGNGYIKFDNDVTEVTFDLIKDHTYQNVESIIKIYKTDPYNQIESVNFDTLFNGSSIERIREDSVNQNVYTTKVYNNTYDKEIACSPSIFADTIHSPYWEVSSTPVGSKTDDELKSWLDEQYKEWTNVNSRTNSNSKRLLSISNYNSQAGGIEDARNYSLVLPSNIERIHCVYTCLPYCQYINGKLSFGFWKQPIQPQLYDKSTNTIYSGTQISTSVGVYTGFIINNNNYIYTNYVDINGNGSLHKYDGSVILEEEYKITNFKVTINNVNYTLDPVGKIVEYDAWSQLEKLQQAVTAYYVRGSNEIKQILSMISNNIQLTGSFQWSNKILYEDLKKYFYCVEYKPMLDQKYINYDYNLSSDGSNVRPIDVNNYNLPYKTVSDVQIYPLLEYNLSKGSDNNTNLKIVTKNPIILNYTAGDKITIDNQNYLITSIEYIIDNKTIECTLTLVTKIIQNSMLSSLRDSIRVSSNLSTEDTVTSDINILSEQVISIDDRKYTDYRINIDNDYFTQNFGKALTLTTYANLGLKDYTTDDNKYINPQSYISKYPIRFSKLINNNIDSTGEYSRYVEISTGYPYSTERFYFSKYPIYVREVSFDGSYHYGDRKAINNDTELQSYLYYNARLCVLYTKLLFVKKAAVKYIWTEFGKTLDDGNVWYTQLRPEMWSGEAKGSLLNSVINCYFSEAGWPEIKYELVSKIDYSYSYGKYNLYITYTGDNVNNDTYNVFSSDGILTSTKNISSYVYLIDNPAYLNTRYTTSLLPSNIIDTIKKNSGLKTSSFANFSKTDPIYYNQSNTGCLLQGFGSEYSDLYGTKIFPNLFGYSTIMDLREIPRPMLQYKTLYKNTDKVIIKELSNTVDWMNSKAPIGFYDLLNIPSNYYLLKIPNSLTLNDLEWNKDTINKYVAKYSDNNFINKVLNSKTGMLALLNPITKDSENDYVFVQCDNSTIDNITYVNPIIRFNIVDNTIINTFYIHMDIRNSYDTLPHNKEIEYYNISVDKTQSFTTTYTFDLADTTVEYDSNDIIKLLIDVDIIKPNGTTFYKDTILLTKDVEFKQFMFGYGGSFKMKFTIENNKIKLTIDLSDLTGDEYYELPTRFSFITYALYKEV